LESKSAALVAAVFVDFPTNKCNFLHKNKLAIVRRIQFFTGRRPVMSFSRGAVATVALWKSAPVIVLFFFYRCDYCNSAGDHYDRSCYPLLHIRPALFRDFRSRGCDIIGINLKLSVFENSYLTFFSDFKNRDFLRFLK